VLGQRENLVRSIESKAAVLEKIKALRDKTTHADKDYFNNPSKINKKYGVIDSEIDELLELASKILRFHYAHIFSSDLDMKIYSSSNVDSVLTYVRAFDRFWHDKRLNNVKKYIYKLEDYKK